MRKRCHRTRRREVAHTLIAYFLNPEVSTQERISVEAIKFGWAKPSHLDVLIDCHNMLALAANERIDQQTMAVCDLVQVAIENIKDRYASAGKIGATGDELQALYMLVDQSEDFWKRQAGSTFIDAEAALSNVHAEQRARRAA
jgi:hypothetical protein